MNRIEVLKGDITTLKVDAIVNAANKMLLGGGGVDGAIHRAAGPELLRECQTLGGCETGEAKITKGYQLPAKYVIHTVGPVWHGGGYREGDLLERCYTASMMLAVQHECRSIAFPAISCGVYGFPVSIAAEIAVRTIEDFLKRNSTIEKVYLVCFDEEVFSIYQFILKKHSEASYAIPGSAWETLAEPKKTPPKQPVEKLKGFNVGQNQKKRETSKKQNKKKETKSRGGFFN